MVLVCTEAFLALAHAVAQQRGFPSLPMVVLPHPIGGRGPEELVDAIDAAMPDLVRALVSTPTTATSDANGTEDRWIDAPADVEEFLAFAQRRGFGDGLPMVPPTPARVENMLTSHGWDPTTVVGQIRPSERSVDLLAIATSAVLAGCEPEVLPVVAAAVEATLAPQFNLEALQATTHPVTPLLIVHGPVVRRLGFNAAANVLGQGTRANATVGRALRLVLQNVGDAHPGITDRATHGTPAKYTYCMAESDAVAAWPPFQTTRGVAAEQSAVTVLGAEGPHNVNDHGSTDADGLVATIADTLATAGSNDLYLRGQPLLVLSPEHAQMLAADGVGRHELQTAIHERSAVPVAHLSSGNVERFQRVNPQLFDPPPTSGLIPMLDSPERLLVVVAGGPGKHSLVVPTFGSTEAVTLPVPD